MKRFWSIAVLVAVLFTLRPVRGRAVELDVGGKSALLMDISTGQVLYEKNAHEKLAPASVTKVMTLLLIMEAIDDGRIGWQDMVTASEETAAKGGSQIYLKVGETMPVSDMVKSIAVSSANDCACAMAEHLCGSEGAFVDMMNARAAQRGMEDTHFVNCTGLDDGEDASRHRTCAYDIALMSRQLMLYHPKIKDFTTIWMDPVRDGAFGLSNTNKLIRFYSGATGLKTGFTSGAGYCLSATAERDGLGLIAVVMGCETSKERTAACKSMLDYGCANFAYVSPELPEDCRVPVTLGASREVTALPGESTQLLISKGKKGSVTQEVTLMDGVEAAVQRGQSLGRLTIRAGEEILAEIPLVASDAVDRLTWGRLTLLILRQAAMALPEKATENSTR